MFGDKDGAAIASDLASRNATVPNPLPGKVDDLPGFVRLLVTLSGTRQWEL